ASAIAAQTAPVATTTQAAPTQPLPAFSGGGKPNRRRHVRTRVTFTACIRHSAADEEIVECDNVSKGGLCFRSRKRYDENAPIDIAAPYDPGQPAFFVPAHIKRTEEPPAAGLFRYGVAYG